jgi:hypothetical protein
VRQCPPEFQEAFTREGGTNQYGEPIFKLVWGPDETQRSGGYWARDGFVGYRDYQVAGPDACWVLMMWKPAESFGSDVRWYYHHQDEATGLQELGEYPYHGRYIVIQKLIHYEKAEGRLQAEILEVSSFLIDVLLPAVRFWQALNEEEKLTAIRLEMELEENELLDEMMDAKADCAPAWRGAAASYTNQGCRTSLLARKVEVMERGMRDAMRMAAQMPRGLMQLPTA